MVQYTDEELIAYLQDYLEEYDERPTVPALHEVDEYPSPPTFRRRFGSWNEALRAADITDRHETLSRERVLDAINALAGELGHPPSAREMTEATEYPSRDPFEREFGSWSEAVSAAGFDPATTGEGAGKYHPSADEQAETVHIRAEVTPEQRDRLDAIAHSRTEGLRHLLDEHAEQCLGQDPAADEPEKVVCDRCGGMSVPLFWYDDQIHCRPCIRERIEDWEWPPTDDED